MSEEAPVFSREGLVRDLRALGVRPGDALLVHSTVTALAPARELARTPDTGMAWLLEALREAVGPEGLIAVPTFTKTFKDERDGPTGDVWNPASSPSRVGSFTNYLRTRPGAARSDHPTHSVAALGAGAAEFCSGHSWRTGASTFDRDGPWGRLADLGERGRILWLGTDMRTQTAVHVVEDWMRLPYMASCTALVDDGGRTVEVQVTQSPKGSRDFYRQPSKAARAWAAAGLSSRGRVGRAGCELMAAAGFIDWLWSALLADPGLLLREDRPDDRWSLQARERTAAHLEGFKGSWRRQPPGASAGKSPARALI